MSRLQPLAGLISLFAAFVILLLSPQTVKANPISGDPVLCDCPPCDYCPPQIQSFCSFISLTEGNGGDDYHVAQVRSAFGTTMDFTLIYNSYNADGTRAHLDTVVGFGWTHSYNDFLFSHGGDMFRMRGDGRVVRYALNSDGTYQTSPGYFETLVKNPDGSFDVTNRYQTDYHYVFIPNTPFHVRGRVFRVTSITDRNGNQIFADYVNGDLTSITDTYGRSFQLGYNGSHHLVNVTTPMGDVTTLTYDPSGSRLLAISDPTEHIRMYAYNDHFQITSKVDRDGRLFTLLYRHNRPYSELDGNGNPLYALTNTSNWGIDRTQLEQNFMRVYIPSKTSKTDGRGNVWQYPYNSDGHVLKVIAPDGTTTSYAYDPATLLVASMTDGDGNTTEHTYDAEGNELTRTDALGHVTTYTYESQFNQMLTMTDPQGRVTNYTYDSRGNRLSETDPLNGTRQWTYDSHGNVLTDTDKNGHTTTYTYDADGNRGTVTDALNELTKYVHDIMGNKTSMTDANGNTTKYQYDALYRLVLETNALNESKHYSYDGEGDRIEVINESGHPTSYAYDLRRRLVTTTDALGGSITYTYDGNDNKVSMTDQNGHITTYAYDVQNRLIRTTDALGNTSTQAYDPVGNPLSETDAIGHITTYQYDALNRRIQKTDALNEISTWGYDLTGLPGHPKCSGPILGSDRVTEQTDGNGKVIYYCYDGLDRLIIEIHKQGGTAYVITSSDAVTHHTYDLNSNRRTKTEPNGNVTTYTYDAVNRQVKMVNAAGDTTITTYDSFGSIKTIAAPNGNVTTYTYDALNRRTQETDSDGPVSSSSYDPVGNQVIRTDGDGNLTSYTYDALNRQITMIDALGKVVLYFYDPVGNGLKMIDREGNPTTYSYDAINRLLCTTNALPAATCFQYDPVGNRITITDAKHHTTAFAYDKVNRKISETYPDPTNNTIVWAYDAVGNVISRTDQKSQITAYTYSDLYFLLSRAYSPSGSTDTFTYDLSGRVLSGTRGGWIETFAYDGADRLIQSAQNGRTISYVYNIPGRTRKVNYPGGRSITEQWDFRPQILTINDGGSSPIAQYAYDPANNVLTRAFRNGTAATYTYNANNWVCSLTHNRGANLIVGFTHAYDHEGNKFYEQKLHKTNDSEAYAYDPVYRLIDYKAGLLASSPPPNCAAGPVDIPIPITQTAYNLDKLGNWNSKDTDGVIQARTHSPSNEIASINGSPVSSDNNGNTAAFGQILYSYDEENRLTTATQPLGAVLGQYQYDAFWRRVSKTDNFGVQIFYYYDGWRTIEEQSAAGVTQATYVFGNYVDEALTMDRVGQPGPFYYHQNALWSVFALTDPTGKGVEGYSYDAYGYQTVSLPGADGILWTADDDILPGAKSSYGSPFLFTGQHYDPEIGLLYYKHRYDSTFFGRFMSRDPKDYDAGDMNLYEYVNSTPTNRIDPDGEWACNCTPRYPPLGPCNLAAKGTEIHGSCWGKCMVQLFVFCRCRKLCTVTCSSGVLGWISNKLATYSWSESCDDDCTPWDPF